MCGYGIKGMLSAVGLNELLDGMASEGAISFLIFSSKSSSVSLQLAEENRVCNDFVLISVKIYCITSHQL